MTSIAENYHFRIKLIVKKPNTGGGLALIWKSKVQLDVVSYTENHILAKVVDEDGFEWYLTGFYGWPDASQNINLGLSCHTYPQWLMSHGVALETLMLFYSHQRSKAGTHHRTSRWRTLD